MRLYWIPPAAAGRGAYVHYPFDDLLGILALESQRNRCMVIGEDLGTVPDELRSALAARGVLSYRVLLFERDGAAASSRRRAYPVDALVRHAPTICRRSPATGKAATSRPRAGWACSPTLRGSRSRRAPRRARLLAALDARSASAGGHPARADFRRCRRGSRTRCVLARAPSRLMMVQLEDVVGALEQVNLPGTTDEQPNWRRKLPLRSRRSAATAPRAARGAVIERARRCPQTLAAAR